MEGRRARTHADTGAPLRTPGGHASRVAAVLASAARATRWYVRGVTGADAYDRYVDYLARTDPGAAVPTARDFWREKYAAQDRNPSTRCC